MRVAGAIAGGLLLHIGAFFGLMAWVAGTCTGNAPDSLFAGVLALPLNVCGFALLCRQRRTVVVLGLSALPALSAVRYSVLTLELASGRPACELITEYGPWERSGDEPFLSALWIAVTASFWLGLACALYRAYRTRRKDRFFDPDSLPLD